MVPSVMIVDDDKTLRETLQRGLRNEPYRLVFADSAVNCLEALTGIEAQVIVTDRSMPGLNGAELLEHLRTSRPDMVRIMLSGDLQLKTALEAVNVCEAFRVLHKPCGVAEIAIAIREGLQFADQLRSSKRLLEVLNMQAHYIRSMETPEGVPVDSIPPSEIEPPTDLDEILKAAVKQVEEIEELLVRKGKKSTVN